MKIAMIGSGYVGLVSGACFADFGHEVICVDKDPNKIDQRVLREIDRLHPAISDLAFYFVPIGKSSLNSP